MSSHRIHFKCRYPTTHLQIASDPIVASLKLLARRGLTDRSTGHFAAVKFRAQKPSPKFAHRKVPVSSNVRPLNLHRAGIMKLHIPSLSIMLEVHFTLLCTGFVRVLRGVADGTLPGSFLTRR